MTMTTYRSEPHACTGDGCRVCLDHLDKPAASSGEATQIKYLTKEEIIVLYEHLKNEYLHHGMIEVMEKISRIANNEQWDMD